MNSFYNTDNLESMFNGIREDVENYLASVQQHPICVHEKLNIQGNIELVTKTDTDIEYICIKRVKQFMPLYNIISEESAYRPITIEYESSNIPLVVIDPIDGTSSLIKGYKDWSISLAVILGSIPVAAMLFFPAKKSLITGFRNQNTIKLNGASTGLSICESCLAVSPRQISNAKIKLIANITGYKTIAVPSLTSKVYALLIGEAAAAAYLPHVGMGAKLWDYAAAFSLLHFAGGQADTLDPSLPLDYSGKQLIHSGGWFASRSSALHHKALSQARVVLGLYQHDSE